jgi:CCR4-NOT transcription complex subunit 6
MPVHLGDIVCLQEVQSDHFEQAFNPSMKERGYDSIFKQKTRDSCGNFGKVIRLP